MFPPLRQALNVISSLPEVQMKNALPFHGKGIIEQVWI